MSRRWRSSSPAATAAAVLGAQQSESAETDLHFEMNDILDAESESERSSDFYVATDFAEQAATFDIGSLGKFHAPVSSYEGRHRYDPDFRWTTAAEKRVVRKIDRYLCAFVCLMFFALQVDRGNIMQALSLDMLDDLGLSRGEYNIGQTVYFAFLLFAELPTQLLAKRMGVEVLIPLQMIAWSIVAGMQAGIWGRWPFWTTRAFVGLFEGGFVPSMILYLSYFYTSTELPVRLAWLWSLYPVTTVFTSLLTYAILYKSGLGDIPVGSWRLLFMAEGAMTFIIGCIAYFYLPPSPTQTASKFRGEQGWFNVTEEKIIVNRILRDDPSKGSMRNHERITRPQFLQCLCQYEMWPLFLLGLTWQLPSIPIIQYLPTNLRTLGLSTFQVIGLSLPSYTLWTINLLLWTWASEWLNERFLISTLSQIWCIPMLIVSEMLFPRNRDHWHTYVLTFLLFAQPYIHAIFSGLASRNAGSVQSRTVSAALYNMCVQASYVIGSLIYRKDDAPMYFRGNKMLIIIAGYNFFLLIWTKWYYVRTNQRRELVWGAMSRQEKQTYLATTRDRGNRRLDFRFAH